PPYLILIALQPEFLKIAETRESGSSQEPQVDRSRNCEGIATALIWASAPQQGGTMTMISLSKGFVLAATVLALSLIATPTAAQKNSAAGTLVIQGGTLIDGTGKAPLENAVIVIEGARIKAVGKQGEVSIPKGSRIINTKGKTLLP